MNWDSVPLGEVATVRSGFAFRSADWADEGVAVVKIQNVRDGGVNLENCSFVPPDVATAADRFRLAAGDVLITMSGEIGAVGLFRHHKPALLNQRVGRLEDIQFDRVDRRYLSYTLLNAPAKVALEQSAYGVAQANISPKLIEALRIPLPPLPVQRKIAAILSTYDDLIENNNRRIKILEEMAQRIYREWFVDLRYPGHDCVPLVDSELGPIPEGWEASCLGNVAQNYDRQRKPLSGMVRALRPGSYPYFGAAKIFDFIDDFIFDGEYLLMAEDGSVVTPSGGPVLQYVSGKFWANNHTHVLRGTGISTEHLYLLLANVSISGYITGAAQPKITQANMNRIPCLVPTTPVAEAFDRVIRPLLRESLVLGTQNVTLTLTRDLLLPRLISGEVDVTDLDIATAEAAA